MRRRLAGCNRWRAFTLVELLVVVSIIALLIAILLPSLRAARLQAKAVVCSSHMYSLAHAMMMYAGEYNDTVPPKNEALDDPNFGIVEIPYAVYLLEEMGFEIDKSSDFAEQFKAYDVLQCPTFPQDNRWPDGTAMPEQTLDFLVNGFDRKYEPDPNADALLAQPDYNARPDTHGYNQNSFEYYVYTRLNEVKRPGLLIYLSEVHRLLPGGPEYAWNESWPPWPFNYHDVWRGSQMPLGKTPRVANDLRHPNGINAVFFDAHVERRHPNKMVETDWYTPPPTD